MPLPRSIPSGQTQFTAQRYRALLEQRGHRVPASLKKLTTQDDAQPELMLEQIQQLERAKLTTQADYLTIRTAARLRVLRGSGQTEARTAQSKPIDNASNALNKSFSIHRRTNRRFKPGQTAVALRCIQPS